MQHTVPDRMTEFLVRVAVLANLAAAYALSQAYAWSQTLFNTADESGHFDYAYEVWEGKLPVFERGLDVKPDFASLPPVQWTAQHPPLYYLYEAPFVGPFIDHGHVVWAGFAGRAASGLVACAVVAAVMWAVHAIAPGRRALWLAAGTVTAVLPPVVAVGGTIYNDNMLVMWAALTIGITARILHSGITRKRLTVLALVGSGLLLTRLSGAVVFGICGGTLGVVTLVRSWRDWRLVAGLAVAGIVPLLASGWYYARNVHLVGNIAGYHSHFLEHRISRPFRDVVVDPEVWRQWHAIYGYGTSNPSGTLEKIGAHYIGLFGWVMVGLPLLVGAAVGLRQILRRRQPLVDIPLAVVVVGIPLAVLVMQAEYVSNRGGASWRYLMPMVPVIALAVAAVVGAWPRLRPWLLTGWVAVAVIPFAASVGRSLETPDHHSTGPQLPAAACVALGLGFAAVAVALMSQLQASRRLTVEPAALD